MKDVIDIDSILKTVDKKGRIKKYFFLIVGSFFLALAFNVFFKPISIVTGGVSGISIVVYKLFGIDTTIFIAISYVILLIISLLVLGKETTKHSLIGSILYPVFVYLTQDIGAYIHFNVDNMLLIVLFGAVINGIGSGLTFKYGFSTGGGDIIFQILSKYFKMSIGDAMRIINSIIIVSAGFFITKGTEVYAWENVMYAIIVVYIVSILNDRVLLGLSESKSFYIITEHEDLIKDFLMNELKRGVTILDARGAYTGNKKHVILCAIPTKEYFLAKEGILAIDKDAVLLINDVYQSEGIE